MDIIVMSEEIRRDFPREFELAVFSNHGLDLFDKCIFGVIAGDIERSVVRVLKFSRIGELVDPSGNCNGAVRSRLVEANFQENSILEAAIEPKWVL